MVEFKIKQVVKYVFIGSFILIVLLFFIIYPKLNDPDFYSLELSGDIKKQIIEKRIWKDSCIVPLERLMLINVKYYSYNNKIKRDGKFIVLDSIADTSLKLFKELFSKKIIIEKINFLNEYKDHQESILENNSISFICDPSLKENISLHKYGLAFEINPLYNPSIQYQNHDTRTIISTIRNSSDFINRTCNFPLKNENIATIFRKYGFSEWGGNWNYNPNWQYFSINLGVADIILLMNREDSKKFLKIIVNNIDLVERFNKIGFAFEINNLYQKNHKKFLKVFSRNFKKLKRLDDSQFFDLLIKNINKI